MTFGKSALFHFPNSLNKFGGGGGGGGRVGVPGSLFCHIFQFYLTKLYISHWARYLKSTYTNGSKNQVMLKNKGLAMRSFLDGFSERHF